MIEFRAEKEGLVLRYSPMTGGKWIYKKLKKNEKINLKRTFFLQKKHLTGASKKPSPDPDEPVQFLMGPKIKGYFHLDKDILNIDFDLYIYEDVELTYESFTAEKHVSVFSKVKKLSPGDIHIGGDFPRNLPKADFKRLIDNFPNTYELRKYVSSRVSSVLRDFVDTKIDGEEKYRKYMNRKLPVKDDDFYGILKDGEIAKYGLLHEKLKDMLARETSFSEKKWQKEILKIILLLYPKYIRAFKEAPVRDTYANKDRKIDLLLVDSSGNTDIIEIKQPFDKCIVSTNRYRDNYIPLCELSGTVMQVEKYIFYLNKWGKAGEKSLTKKYKSKLPNGLEIKITNPSGIIILGRNLNLSEEQRQDFEVIKRKYKNVIDIITYDDLLNRLRVTIEQLRKQT